MTYREYVAEVLADCEEHAKDYIHFNGFDYSDDAARDFVEDCEFVCTGNDCGSYYFNRDCARDALHGVAFTPEFDDFIKYYRDELGIDIDFDEPETVDVLMRCYIVDQNWSDIEKIYFDKLAEMEDDAAEA